MESKNIQQTNKFVIIAVATGLITFAAIFFGTQMLLNSVYGFEIEANASVGAGLSIPVNADANSQQIDSYISFVKAEVCPTIQNNQTTTAQDECFNL